MMDNAFDLLKETSFLKKIKSIVHHSLPPKIVKTPRPQRKGRGVARGTTLIAILVQSMATQIN